MYGICYLNNICYTKQPFGPYREIVEEQANKEREELNIARAKHVLGIILN